MVWHSPTDSFEHSVALQPDGNAQPIAPQIVGSDWVEHEG